ncbi:MAG: hypothetical protein OSB26_01295 [Woeseiaceae bacterium]|jgi:hypothetical protein|nr:hypothetical protein [Woeseiaceae bacterium]|tara:strand:- start:198 stop:359 length:162 start_codon:yes stop_codon:yes gene_type:complete
MKQTISILSILSLLLLGGFSIAADSVRAGQPAPDFELADQDGQVHSIEDYRGK